MLRRRPWKILLPVDIIVSDDFDNANLIQTIDGLDVPDGFMGMDIGPKTRVLFHDEIQKPIQFSGMVLLVSLKRRISSWYNFCL